MYKQLPLIIAMSLTLGTAHAAEAHRLAHSSKMGVEVFALPQGDGTWCKDKLDLEVRMQPDSALLPDSTAGLMPKLAPVFAAECQTAKTAKVTPLIVQTSGSKAAGEPYVIDGAKGWQKVAVESAKPALSPDVASAAPGVVFSAPTETPKPANNAGTEGAATQAAVPNPPQVLTVSAPLAPYVEQKPVGTPASANQDASASSPMPSEPHRPKVDQYPALDWYLLAHARAYHRPELRGSPDLNRAFAYTQDCVGYNKVSRNELDLQDFVAKHKAESDRLASQVPQRALLTYEVRLAEYDQARQGFPLDGGGAGAFTIGLRHKQTQQCAYYGGIPQPDRNTWPYQFNVEFEKDAAPSFLPMALEDARAFLKRNNGYRTVDVHSLVDIVKYEVNDHGWHKVETFTIRPAWVEFHENNRASALLGSVSSKELEAIRAANEAVRRELEAKRQEEERIKMAKRMEEMRQVRMEQRQEQLGRLVQSATPAQRAGYLNLDEFYDLETAADATLWSVRNGLAQKVTLLVQADSSGNKDVPAAWPGRLILDAEGGEVEDFKSGHWYLVEGMLSAETPKANQILGRISVTKAVHCEKEACGEYADEELVKNRIDEMARQYALQSYPEAQ